MEDQRILECDEEDISSGYRMSDVQSRNFNGSLNNEDYIKGALRNRNRKSRSVGLATDLDSNQKEGANVGSRDTIPDDDYGMVALNQTKSLFGSTIVRLNKNDLGSSSFENQDALQEIALEQTKNKR